MSKYAKFWVAAGTAALAAVVARWTNDAITQGEATTLILTALGALGVYAIPNTPAPANPEV